MTLTPEELAAVRERHDNIPQEGLPLEDADDLSLWVWPPAVQHCHYRGRLEPQHGRVMGPMLTTGDAQPQYLTVVDQTYDEATDRTTLGLTYGIVAPTEPGESP